MPAREVPTPRGTSTHAGRHGEQRHPPPVTANHDTHPTVASTNGANCTSSLAARRTETLRLFGGPPARSYCVCHLCCFQCPLPLFASASFTVSWCHECTHFAAGSLSVVVCELSWWGEQASSALTGTICFSSRPMCPHLLCATSARSVDSPSVCFVGASFVAIELQAVAFARGGSTVLGLALQMVLQPRQLHNARSETWPMSSWWCTVYV